MTLTPSEQQTPPLTVRFIAPADGPAVRALFQAVFDQPMSEALWHWKYQLGENRCVGVFHDGELIAHYGTIGAAISYFGQPAKALQVVDVMVKPAYRRAAKKASSPFYRAGHYCAEHSVGYDRPFLLGYGFPSDRHMLLAQHLDLYTPVGRMFEVFWPVSAPVPGAGWWHRVQRIDNRNFAALRQPLMTLWQQLQQDLAGHIVVRKDADWLQRRYLAHPEQRYTLHLQRQRFGGRPLGLIVLKEEAEQLQLMDYVGPLAHLPRLLQYALHCTYAAGKARLCTWCSEVFLPRFSCHGGEGQPLRITTPATTRQPGPLAAELQDRWWLLPGDTDFL